MTVIRNISKTAKRFEWAMKRKPHGPRTAFDVDLYNLAEAAVCPTVGSIVPGWLLVIPRFESACFANLPLDLRSQIQLSIQAIRGDFLRFEGTPWLFEHGAISCGSDIACGVDQAHVHMAPLQPEFFNLVKLYSPELAWEEIENLDPWAKIHVDREYYFLSDFHKSYVAYPKNPTSQFFRRAIANTVGRATEWDYRLFSNEQNAAETIRRLKGCREQESAA